MNQYHHVKQTEPDQKDNHISSPMWNLKEKKMGKEYKGKRKTIRCVYGEGGEKRRTRERVEYDLDTLYPMVKFHNEIQYLNN